MAADAERANMAIWAIIRETKLIEALRLALDYANFSDCDAIQPMLARAHRRRKDAIATLSGTAFSTDGDEARYGPIPEWEASGDAR